MTHKLYPSPAKTPSPQGPSPGTQMAGGPGQVPPRRPQEPARVRSGLDRRQYDPRQQHNPQQLQEARQQARPAQQLPEARQLQNHSQQVRPGQRAVNQAALGPDRRAACQAASDANRRAEARQARKAPVRAGALPSRKPTAKSWPKAPTAASQEAVLTGTAQQALRFDRLLFLAFLLPLVLLGLLFIFWPTEAISQAEQRALAQFPDFSWDSLYKGDFSAGLDSYYADQFPLREGLLDLNRSMKNLLTFTPGGEDQIHLITAQKDGGGQGGVENPLASQEPEPTLSQDAVDGQAGTVPSQENLATETSGPRADREIKETEVKLNNQAQLDLETSNIVIIRGQAMEIHYYSSEFTEYYADRLNYLRNVLPEERRLISLVTPTAIAFYGTDELRSNEYSNFSAVTNIYKHEDPSIFKVDAYSELAAHLDEYIYFRTDHHWTGRGAYYAYKAFCDTLELEVPALTDYELTLPEGTFLGSLYGYTDKSPLLLNSADQAEIFQPLHQASYTYYLDSSMTEGYPGTFLAHEVYNENQYMLYLGGDVPLGHIQSDLDNDKSILVVKDSFGNAFIPYLVDQYEEIYVIDPRQYAGDLLAFIEEKDIQDVLVLNYTFAVSNPYWLEGFDDITGYVQPEVPDPAA